MAAMAVSFATNKAEGLAGQLATRLPLCVWGELKLLWGVSNDINYIKEELDIMTAFLRCAEQLQEIDDVARIWVKQVRQLAYEVEDCFDEFALHLYWSSRQGFLASLWRTVRKLGTRHRIATQIPSLKSRVDEVSKRRARYTLTGKAPPASTSASTRRDVSALNVEATKIIGFDGPRDEILTYLLRDDDRLGVIAVTGMAGLGKTTLARKVYQSAELRDGRFPCRAWISVSTSFELEDLLKDILRQVKDNSGDRLEGSLLYEAIRSHLQDRRYLIVLDDVWTIGAWRDLESKIPKNNLKSRIIVTTRIRFVSDACCTEPHHRVYELQRLPIDKSLELFCKRVFPPPDHSCPPNLAILTDEVLKKCGGLPLIISTVAGLLASKPERTREDDWRNMLEHLGSELESNPSLEAMKQALTLGYVDLHYHLMHCFLYLSIFPDDHLIKRKRVQRLWLAEGFVRARRTMNAEQVAESYFDELISRNMILAVEMDPQGKVKSFRVHDVILELIVSKAIEANTVALLDCNCLPAPDDIVRRLSVHDPGAYDSIPENTSLARVQTLTMFGGTGKKMYPQLNRMSLLRVLDFEGCRHLRNSHLQKMSRVPHLRYLSLRGTRVQELPEQFGELRNLETLDLRDTEIIEIPKWIVKLRQLRYLRGGCRIKPQSITRRERKQSVTGNLNAYHRTRIPRGIKRVKSLETLTDVDMRLSRSFAKELGQLTQLRKLGVYSLTTKDGLEFCSSISMLSSQLRSLSIDFDNSEPCVAFLDVNLTPPPLGLRSLALCGPLTKLPDWVGLLKKLGKLTLHYTSFRDETLGLHLLQDLPILMHFTLWNTAYVGTHLCFCRGFPELKVLHIHRSYPLKSISFGAGTMPKLEQLHLSACFNLEDISGSHYLTNLKEIVVSDAYTNIILDIARGAVAEHPNKPKLVVE